MNIPGPSLEERVEVWSALHLALDWIVCAAGVLVILAGLFNWWWVTR